MPYVEHLLTLPMSCIDRQRLLTKVSQFYYFDELTQAEIASRLRLSRQKVQRLIREARESGIVHISIRPITGIFGDLERRLQERYGLHEAVVVEASAFEDQPVVSREVGAGAAGYLLRIVQPHDRIAISWGGTLLGMVNMLAAEQPRQDLAGVTVIQGLGGLGDPNNEAHAGDLARRLAKVLGGSVQLLAAPGVAGSRASRNALCADPHVARVLEQGRQATIAFMGIGAPRPDSILIRQGAIVRWNELAELMKRGVVGDINLRYFDRHGRPVASELDERVVGLTLSDLKGIKHVVGVAGGAAKLQAIRGALEGKLVHALVTDQVTAARLVEDEGRSAPGHSKRKERQ